MKKSEYLILTALIICLFLLTGCKSNAGIIVSSKEGREGTLSNQEIQKSELNIDNGQRSAETDTASSVKSETLCVSVVGEVMKPGVYMLPSGSRIYELINAAGGYTKNADDSNINLVYIISDGMQLTVPSIKNDDNSPDNGSTLITEDSGSNISTGLVNGSFGSEEGGKVNINTADISSLTTLPGIGNTRAEAIIEYRESNGGFNSIEDIMNVSGIKEGTFDKLKSKITVD